MNQQWLLDWQDLVAEIEQRMLYNDVVTELLDSQYKVAREVFTNDGIPVPDEFQSLYEAAKKQAADEYNVVVDVVNIFHFKEV